jgi:hypothetical protein
MISSASFARESPLGRCPWGDALWLFLESWRGTGFCAGCLRGVLATTRRIDRTLLALEGRGARRYHAPCMMCGKDRLLCGLSPSPPEGENLRV